VVIVLDLAAVEADGLEILNARLWIFSYSEASDDESLGISWMVCELTVALVCRSKNS
jgi:hypothetical protein